MQQIFNCFSSILQFNRKGELQLENFWINISGEVSSNTPHTNSGMNY